MLLSRSFIAKEQQLDGSTVLMCNAIILLSSPQVFRYLEVLFYFKDPGKSQTFHLDDIKLQPSTL